jgi:hypothetical protein
MRQTLASGAGPDCAKERGRRSGGYGVCACIWGSRCGVHVPYAFRATWGHVGTGGCAARLGASPGAFCEPHAPPETFMLVLGIVDTIHLLLLCLWIHSGLARRRSCTARARCRVARLYGAIGCGERAGQPGQVRGRIAGAPIYGTVRDRIICDVTCLRRCGCGSWTRPDRTRGCREMSCCARVICRDSCINKCAVTGVVRHIHDRCVTVASGECRPHRLDT